MKQMARGRRREAIISAALACAAEVGWGATSLQAVRQRAGVSNGTLFHYFPTRQHLETAALAAGLACHQSALLAELERHAVRRRALLRPGAAGLPVLGLLWLRAQNSPPPKSP